MAVVRFLHKVHSSLSNCSGCKHNFFHFKRIVKQLKYPTIRFHSFTNENIPSVCDYKFVGNLFTDAFTDGIRSSAFLSSLIPHFVAISVKNTKKSFANGFTDGICAEKKNFSCLKYTDGFYPVSDSVIYWRTHIIGKFIGECLKYRPNISVYKFIANCDNYYQMPTD